LSKKIIVSVISDLVTDQRVQKECGTLHKMGYEVLLIGRESKRIFLLKELPFKTIRFYNPFCKGPFMYLIFNAQLFFYLLFKKADVLWSNDLDTLLPNFIISRLKNAKLVYDSHEYFTESVIKKTSKKIWEFLERILFPHLKNVITVNNSIKEIYEKQYKVPVTVIRNVPYQLVQRSSVAKPLLPANKKILVMQGNGLNENRGAEEAVLTMQYLPDEFMLYFIGGGTIINDLKQTTDELKLNHKIIFIDLLPYTEMMEYTRQCFLGLIFEKIDTMDEHRFSLPNKFFDYIHAGVPVLSSKAVEIEAIMKKYNIGAFIESFDPAAIAKAIIDILMKKEMYNQWKQNTVAAAREYNWENEENILIHFMNNLV
jgi:glycosyltransferase involved in cell wall biosynthesis